MIQDIYPGLKNEYRGAEPSEGSRMLVFSGEALLSHVAGNGGSLSFPCLGELMPAVSKAGRSLEDCLPVYAFSIGGDEYFLLTEDFCGDVPGFEYNRIGELRKLDIPGSAEIFAAFTAYHLIVWYRSARFCGCCGERTVFDEKERAMVCPSCGNRIYPRLNPAVIVGVINGDRILITKYRVGYGHSALVAGFTEIGETLEETVRREVMEEAGVKVRDIVYYKSQPWGYAQDILMGFYCRVDGDDGIVMSEDELSSARWVRREDIELQPTSMSLTNEMMKMFKEGKIK